MNAASVIESPKLAERGSRSTSKGEPRQAFVGVGWIGLNRSQAARQRAPVDVAAGAAESAEARDKAAVVAPDAILCADLHQVLDEPIDGVVIATPSGLHAQHACQALQAGKAVFCQKPLARTAAETRQVVAAAVEDFAQASWTTETGAAVRLTCSWRLSAGCDAVIEASFYGARGAVRLRNVGGSFYDFIVQRMTGTASQAIASPPDEWGGRCLADRCRRLARDQRYDPSVERVVHVADSGSMLRADVGIRRSHAHPDDR